MDLRLVDDTLLLGPNLRVGFQRTLRIPDDGGTYPLPPSLGTFPVRRVADYADRVPASWLAQGGVFLPMYQREAMWLSFGGGWPPVALKVGIGGIDAISGEPWTDSLDGRDQDYLVCPDQPWLDGINAGDGFIRQFVAMPRGTGYTVEGQLAGRETVGGIQLLAFAAHLDRLPPRPTWSGIVGCVADSAGMGLSAGGRMKQDIDPDEYGAGTWDPEHTARVFVHIADSLAWREITGEEPPPTPVSARTYSDYGLPWFSLYNERRGDVPAPESLRRVLSVREMDDTHGVVGKQDDSPVAIAPPQVVELGASHNL